MEGKKEKKNIKKLFGKKKKDKETASGQKEPEAEEVSKPTDSQQDNTNDPDSPDPQAKSPAPTPVKEDDGDDESDDELDKRFAGGVTIIDKQAEKQGTQDDVQADYMLQTADRRDGDQAAKEKPKRKNANEISFGGKPSWGGRRGKPAGIAGDPEFVSLDQIDNEGKEIKSQKKNTVGDDKFVNLGSTPIDRSKKEEEKQEEKKPAERPRFFGKAKIGGGEAKQNTGTNIAYDFGVKYKSEHTDNKKPQDKERKDEGNTTEVRKDRRRINQDKGARFGPKDQGLEQDDLDDGFEIVRDPNQKRRQQRVQARTEDKDGEQKEKARDDGFKLTRGGAFGNLGGNDSD